MEVNMKEIGLIIKFMDMGNIFGQKMEELMKVNGLIIKQLETVFFNGMMEENMKVIIIKNFDKLNFI